MDVWEWVSEWSEYCSTCHDSKMDEDCNTCEARAPTLMPVNYDAYILWQHSQTQWLWSGGMETILTGLNYPAVYKIAKTMDIEITPNILSKIQALEWSTIRRLRQKMEQKRK